uniref:Uncharacterized protein n=1 Tax=Rhizophora mucronata TaxID=61149 RepID=A0A2P2NKT1_RHIMU
MMLHFVLQMQSYQSRDPLQLKPFQPSTFWLLFCAQSQFLQQEMTERAKFCFTGT